LLPRGEPDTKTPPEGGALVAQLAQDPRPARDRLGRYNCVARQLLARNPRKASTTRQHSSLGLSRKAHA